MAKTKPSKPTKLPTKTTSVKASSSDDFLSGVYAAVEKNYAAVFFLLLTFLVLFVFKDFMFGNKLFLFKDIGSDTINIFYPQYAHLSDYLKSDGLPKWSFNAGMGQNFLAFSFGDPFQFFYSLFDKNTIPYVIVYGEAIKIFLAGTFFFFFLKTLRLSAFACIIGGLVYAFSGFMMIGSAWYVFSYEGVLYAILLWAIELTLSQKKWQLIPIATCLFGAYNPFNLAPAALLLLGYTTARFLYSSVSLKKIPLTLIVFAGAGILGVLMGSVFLFSNIEQLLQSPRVGGDASYFSKLSATPILDFASGTENASIILRSFSSDLAGTGNNFKGFQNYLESPATYCGLMSLLLFPIAFFTIDKRKRIVLLLFFTVALVPLVFPYFRYLFWMFAGDYYRSLSLFESIVWILLSMITISHLEKSKTNKPILLIGSLMLSLFILFMPSDAKDKIIVPELSKMVTLLLFAYTALLLLMTSGGLKSFSRMLIIALVVIELGYLSNYPFEKRPEITKHELSEKTGYNDYTQDAVNYIKKTDHTFYRMYKDIGSGSAMHSSLNDAKVQNFYGTAYYNSFPQKYYVDFMEETGIIPTANENATRWCNGLAGFTILESLMSVKYAMRRGETNNLSSQGFDSITTLGDTKIYQNHYSLPLGFTYQKYLTRDQFKQLSSVEKKGNTLLYAFVTENKKECEGLLPFNMADTNVMMTFEYYRQLTDSLKADSLNITSHTQNLIEGKINLSKKKMLFLSIPYDAGWHATVDGRTVVLTHCNIGFMGLLIDKGTHTIKLNFEPVYLKSGLMSTLVAILIYLLLMIANKMNWFRKRSVDIPS